MRSCNVGFISFVFIHGDEMLQKTKVDLVRMRRTEGRKSGGKMAPLAAAMARPFRAVVGGEIA